MPKSTSVNIQFIAEVCGVSIATVSRVINKSPHVSDEVVRKVRKAIEAYDYKPIAYKTRQRIKSQKKCHRIGVYSENFFFNQFLQAAGSYISMQGHDMRILDYFTEKRDVADLLKANLAGIIAVGKMSALADSKAGNLPIVRAFGRTGEPFSAYDHVTYDGHQVGRLAADYLARQGSELLVCYTLETQDYNPVRFSRRDAGFRERCHELGVECLSFSMPADRLASLEMIPEFMAHLEERRSNVGYFLYNDLLAVSFYTLMMKKGLKLHRDYRMVSCDNVGEYLSLIPIDIPSIDIKIREIAEHAARLLLWRIDNPEATRVTMTLQPTLEER